MPSNFLKVFYEWFHRDYNSLISIVHADDGVIALNLGCGTRPLNNFVNVDIVDGPGVDRVVDLEEKLPFPDKSFDVIVADNVFEHIKNYLALLEDSSRILRSGGVLVVDVPYFRSASAFIDPTHCNYFTLRSMRYFVPDTYESKHYGYLPILFSHVKVLVNPSRPGFFSACLSLIANHRPEWVENTVLAPLLPVESVRFVFFK